MDGSIRDKGTIDNTVESKNPCYGLADNKRKDEKMKRKANREVRQVMKDKRVYQWEVAEVLGVHESTIIRWMRTKLPEDRKNDILEAVTAVVAAR